MFNVLKWILFSFTCNTSACLIPPTFSVYTFGTCLMSWFYNVTSTYFEILVFKVVSLNSVVKYVTLESLCNFVMDFSFRWNFTIQVTSFSFLQTVVFAFISCMVLFPISVLMIFNFDFSRFGNSYWLIFKTFSLFSDSSTLFLCIKVLSRFLSLSFPTTIIILHITVVNRNGKIVCHDILEANFSVNIYIYLHTFTFVVCLYQME